MDLDLAEDAFDAVANRRTAQGDGWVAHPLPTSDPWQQAALVVFVGTDLATDEELVLSSLSSLIPVAFERALQTEVVVMHEARLRAVVEASPVALIGLRPDGGVSLANRAALDLFQWVTDPTEWALDEPIRPAILELGRVGAPNRQRGQSHLVGGGPGPVDIRARRCPPPHPRTSRPCWWRAWI